MNLVTFFRSSKASTTTSKRKSGLSSSNTSQNKRSKKCWYLPLQWKCLLCIYYIQSGWLCIFYCIIYEYNVLYKMRLVQEIVNIATLILSFLKVTLSCFWFFPLTVMLEMTIVNYLDPLEKLFQCFFKLWDILPPQHSEPWQHNIDSDQWTRLSLPLFLIDAIKSCQCIHIIYLVKKNAENWSAVFIQLWDDPDCVPYHTVYI